MSTEEKTRVVLTVLHIAHVPPNEKLVSDVASAFEKYRTHLKMHVCVS